MSRGGGIVLEDGPAAGTYSVRRAPHLLRAVVSRSDGRVDLLDQLHDEPRPIEAVFVYEAVAGTVFDPDMLARGGTFLCPPPGASGKCRHRADVDGEELRTTEAWRSWARANAPADTIDVTDPNAVVPPWPRP
jgi:hypothetical protein